MKKANIIILTIGFNCLIAGIQGSSAQEPYKLGVQENVPGQSSGGYSYPSPQMIPAPVTLTPRIQKNAPAYTPAPAQSKPAPETFSAGITKVVLPPAFLGVWQVHGERKSVEAMPEFQASAEHAFNTSNDQLWNIAGNPNSGYSLGSNTGINTALFIDKVQGNTAFVRYQHPVGNTMAQEAIVMSLRQGGLQFDGLERISIVKQGLPQPRAKVTYSLSGTRQQ